MDFHNHQDLGPLFAFKRRHKERKDQQQLYHKHSPKLKEEDMLLLTLVLTQTMLFCMLYFYLSGHLLQIYLTLQLLAKVLIQVLTGHHLLLHQFELITIAISEDVHFSDATGIGSGDHDPQEPDSQRDSEIHTSPYSTRTIHSKYG